MKKKYMKSNRSANPFVQREAKVWNQCSGRQIQKSPSITKRPGHLFNYLCWSPQQLGLVWVPTQGCGGQMSCWTPAPYALGGHLPRLSSCSPCQKTYFPDTYFLWTSTSCQERDFLTGRVDWSSRKTWKMPIFPPTFSFISKLMRSICRGHRHCSPRCTPGFPLPHNPTGKQHPQGLALWQKAPTMTRTKSLRTTLQLN